MPRTIVRTLAFLAFACLAGAAEEEGKRVALIIGNDSYSIRPLQNAVSDARAMDKALRGAGFRTILRENVTRVVMEEAVVEFLQTIAPGDTALFFYAGHGVQLEGENVLIPVDFESAKSLIEVKFRSFRLAQLYDNLRQRRAKRAIIILDACRSNPMAEGLALQAGLAMPQTESKETYTAFSTSPNQVANDNPDGQNSWFTEALADLISQPALTIDEIFTRVGQRVEKATKGTQIPWKQGNLTSRFYFHPPENEQAANDPSVAEKWLQDAERHEARGNWPEAIDLLNRVLKQQPGSSLEQKAKARLPYLMARNEAVTRFEAGEFGAAAAQYESALGMDSFAVEAAFEAANSYLLNDQLPEAVRMLQAVRVRGSSAAAQKANAVLKELAAVHPDAERELKAGMPQPPRIQELFGGVRFGVPDWEAGRRYLLSLRVDLAKWAKDLTPPPPAETPALIASAAGPHGAAPLGPITLDSFHVEVVSRIHTRDLMVEKIDASKVNTSGVQRRSGLPVKVTTDPPGANLTVEGDPQQHCPSPCILSLTAGKHSVQAELEGYRTELKVASVAAAGEVLHIQLQQEFGVVALGGDQTNAPVMLDGKPVADALPFKLKVPVGKYEIRAVQEGKTVSSREIEVRPGGTVELSFK